MAVPTAVHTGFRSTVAQKHKHVTTGKILHTAASILAQHHGACFNKHDGPSDRVTDHPPMLFVHSRMVRRPVRRPSCLLKHSLTRRAEDSACCVEGLRVCTSGTPYMVSLPQTTRMYLIRSTNVAELKSAAPTISVLLKLYVNPEHGSIV